jgi:DNA-directed RNA polymerase I subunit RPA2
MMQKLYSNVEGVYGEDNPDSLQFQETLLGGHLMLNIMKEKIYDWIGGIKTQIQMDLRKNASKVNFMDRKYLNEAIRKTSGAADIGKKLDYFLATGNLVSNTGLDLQQVPPLFPTHPLDVWLYHYC